MSIDHEVGSHENVTPQDVPPVVARLLSEARRPGADERPDRCRVVIFDPTGTKVLGIARNRPDREPYVVYPGGGLEDSDPTALAGLWRELEEELGLGPDQVMLTDSVLEHEGQFYYLGVANEEFNGLTIGGPEAERDVAESGSYTPEWFPIDRLEAHRVFPEEISAQLEQAAAHGAR